MNFSEAEDSYRRTIFFENLRQINAENAAQKEYTLGINKFSAMTKDEFKFTYLRLIVPETPVVQVVDTFRNDSEDWRPKGAVTDVKDQG